MSPIPIPVKVKTLFDGQIAKYENRFTKKKMKSLISGVTWQQLSNLNQKNVCKIRQSICYKLLFLFFLDFVSWCWLFETPQTNRPASQSTKSKPPKRIHFLLNLQFVCKARKQIFQGFPKECTFLANKIVHKLTNRKTLL